MTTLSLEQAARLTARGKTILARVISGGIFAGSKEDSVSKIEGAESARVYPFPAPVETPAELRTRLALADERLTELKAMLEDMRRDRDAWREQAQTRLLPPPGHQRHCGGGCGRPDEYPSIFWHGWWRAPKYLSPPAAFGERRHGGFATTIWV